MEQLKVKLPSEIYRSLIDANVRSLPFILSLSKCELAQITKLDLSNADAILRESALILLSHKLHTANEIKVWQRISTGCPSIDVTTRGGIATCGITEIVGCSGVGKTQLCLQLSLMSQLPPQFGGLEKNVMYICTEDVFPIKRLSELSQHFAMKYKNFVSNFEDNIFIAHISDFVQLKRCLGICLPKLASVKRIGLVVIDSIAGVFRSENCDVNYTNRSRDFVCVVAELTKLSAKYGITVVCTNQVADNLDTGSTEPCLGLAWSTLITCRFKINRYTQSQIREFEIVFAPDLPNDNCRFKITREGLTAV